jgi:hypothetical protein
MHAGNLKNKKLSKSLILMNSSLTFGKKFTKEKGDVLVKDNGGEVLYICE